MELGKRIKELRQQRGVSQETLAEALGVTAQAVSKWERDVSAPDVALLPELSAYFGVTIDELFALSDETRIERIQNMMWDERDLDPVAAKREAEFLLAKGRREPENGQVYMMLAWMENHIAQTHRRRAEEYAKEALERDPEDKEAHRELAEAMSLKCPDWYAGAHRDYIEYYQTFVEKNPTVWRAYMWLMDALMEDERLEEAKAYCEKFVKICPTFRAPLYKGLVAWRAGDRDGAMEIWQEMCRDFPEDWMAWFGMGDAMARTGQYGKAVEYYEKCKQFQTKPRFTDPQESIALARELMGDYAGAIAAREEQLALTASDWNTTTGETVEYLRREIQRLRGKLAG